MITVIARFRFQEGQEEAGLQALRTMVNAVKENESGALSYICHRDQQDPTQIVFFEVYKDEEAFAAHRKTDHMKKMSEAFKTAFTGPVDVQRLDRVEGFWRS